MRYISFRLIVGLILVAFGILIFLHNIFGIDIDFEYLKNFWPVIPLIFAIKWLIESLLPRPTGNRLRVYFSLTKFLGSLVLALISIIWLGENLELFEVDLTLFWPVTGSILLIFIGVVFIRGKIASESGNRFAFMGSIAVGGSPWKLRSGSYFAFMGSVDLDLTTAVIPDGETVLDLTAVMGGIDVVIPPGLPVLYEGMAFMGGVSFLDQEDGGIITTHRVEKNIDPETNASVKIQARAIMGGVEIKEKKEV